MKIIEPAIEQQAIRAASLVCVNNLLEHIEETDIEDIGIVYQGEHSPDFNLDPTERPPIQQSFLLMASIKELLENELNITLALAELMSYLKQSNFRTVYRWYRYHVPSYIWKLLYLNQMIDLAPIDDWIQNELEMYEEDWDDFRDLWQGIPKVLELIEREYARVHLEDMNLSQPN